jgi:hypothetical protein
MYCFCYRQYNLIITVDIKSQVGRGSVVSIMTLYGLDGPGIEQWCGEIFRTRPDRPWGPLSILYNGYRGNSRG